jgi:hypothetical protein
VQQVGLTGVLGTTACGSLPDVPFRTRFQEGVGPRTGAFLCNGFGKLGVLYETALCPSSRTDFSKGAVRRRATRPRRLVYSLNGASKSASSFATAFTRVDIGQITIRSVS